MVTEHLSIPRRSKYEMTTIIWDILLINILRLNFAVGPPLFLHLFATAPSGIATDCRYNGVRVGKIHVSREILIVLAFNAPRLYKENRAQSGASLGLPEEKIL